MADEQASPEQVALVQTATMLPMMLLTLPAGALVGKFEPSERIDLPHADQFNVAPEVEGMVSPPASQTLIMCLAITTSATRDSTSDNPSHADAAGAIIALRTPATAIQAETKRPPMTVQMPKDSPPVLRCVIEMVNLVRSGEATPVADGDVTQQ